MSSYTSLPTWVIYNKITSTFVMWFNAYTGGCCYGNFGVAASEDGLRFKIITLNETAVYAQVDSNSLMVDDDGSAYVIYSSIVEDHQVSIEKLTDDYLQSTRESVFAFFPDHYVEGAILYKRNGKYYVSYGSCCCFCRNGSGVVVYQADQLSGPWVRQGPGDLNCQNATKQICGGYGERTGDVLTINAQGIGLSVLPTSTGMVSLWHGERWVSAPNNNPNCPDECRPQTGECAEPSDYYPGHHYVYWIPLQFDEETGDVLRFQPFVNQFELDLV